MSSKEELYRALIESAPYGTLFFAYGVCIDANPASLAILDCDKNHLVGASLNEITGDESSALIDLKLQLKKALKNTTQDVSWQRPSSTGQRTSVQIKIVYVDDSDKELIVTLQEVAASAAAPAAQPQQELERQQEPQPVPQPQVAPLAQSQTSTPGPAAPAPVTETARRPAEEPGREVVAATLPEVEVPEVQKPEIPVADLPESPVLKEKAKAGDDASWQQIPRDFYYDNLTRLPNRQMLIQNIGNFLTKNQAEQICGAILMLDLDHFKDINDSWGHAVGDQVIKKIGRAISGLVTGDNVLARMSGDEFVLFIPNLSDSIAQAAWDAQEKAEKVREVVATPLFLDGHEVILTASIGIALLTDASISAERALQYADTAMYEAKRKGRNSIAFFDPCITEKAQRQIGLNTRLRKAIDNQEFALYIQPQLSVETGELLGGEALLRWMSSEKNTNMPSEFIPVLESSGLIVDVGRWVIRTACEYIRNFLDNGLWKDHMRLGINISPRQFRDPQLLEVVQHSVKSYDIDPRYLNFEITESLVIEDVDEAIRIMEAIKALGSMFSIDDFGIGYSSMIYLKRLPFDQLKIDREFIRNIHRDPESRGVVEAIMAVARQYNLHVTAEGVENREGLSVLKRIGCHAYQGAHYSMPVPYDRFMQLLVA